MARFRSGRGITRLSVLVAVAIGATAGFLIWHDHEVAFEEHERGMQSMGIVLAEQTSRYAQVIDLALLNVQASIGGLGVSTPAEFQSRLATKEVNRLLADSVRNITQVSRIALIDANGLMMNWSSPWPVESVDASDRDFFSYFRDHDDPGLFIGAVAKGRASGQLSLFFARRVSGPGGAFLGLVLGVVNVHYLSDFYRAAGEFTNQAVTLLRRDGTMLMRYPDPALALGVKLAPGSPWYSRVAEGGGSYMSPGILDGVPALVSVHPVQDYPLVVDVVMPHSAIFATWRRDAANIAGFAAAAAIIFVVLFRILGRQFQLQAEQNARLEETSRQLVDEQEKLRAYAEMSADRFWEQDSEFRFKLVSDAREVGKRPWEMGRSGMTEERWAEHKATLNARLPFRNFRYDFVDASSRPRFLRINGDPIFERNGTFAGYRGTGQDITAEVEATARLLELNSNLERGRQIFNAVLDNMSQGVCLFDSERRLLLCNRRYAEIYNLPPEAICTGRTLEEILNDRYASGCGPDIARSEFIAMRERVVAAKRPSTYVVALQNGRTVCIHHQPLEDGGWVATHEDITEQQQAEASIVYMAHHDALTKLPNRILFRERVEQALNMAGRGSQFAVMCIDLDGFKQVNDTLGHPVGDGLLVAVADRLKACLREVDTMARLGGDEFAIIQTTVRSAHETETLANRLIGAFRQPFDVAGHQIMSGISIGVNVVTRDGASFETLLREADIALYLAKTEARGSARFFEPEMDARIHLRRVLEAELRGAIGRNELELYYQPQVDLISNRISGFEALLRWHHPVRGPVSPLDFIPVAEETGMIGAIGEWVLQTACFEAENWPADIRVAVNLSPVQFKKGDVVAAVRSALVASGLRAERLELEITESVFLRDTAETLAALNQLREMGICVALDDFGTGYSSLSYLRSFPFSKIKIDKSFVRDLQTNKGSMSIIRAVTGLGQSLGMKTIAEGVETMDQLRCLRDEMCDEVQGYLFSPPVPAAEVPGLIARLREIGKVVDWVEI